ncbi:WD40/YVTN/BNR-like repeat-containing protein [Halobaculum sp. D14]|uniref:WD40/YVTN/BNR-like repeat-containing protein n=1 Tax=unclassified Halobaculum TaxID=2640896 RepID=UPI003EB80E86
MWNLGPEADRPEWKVVETPFDAGLTQVVATQEGPYAVGESGVIVANRGDGWEVIIEDGPNARQNALNGISVTDDGKRLWFLGSSGAIGMYDVVQQRKYDYSYPNEMTSTWEGITVSGEAGSEKLLAANGSGEVLPFYIDGYDVDWGIVRKPAQKASKIAALASTPDGYGYCIDTSGNAFKTTREEGWNDIGVVNAQVKFYDIYAGSEHKVYIAAGDGRVYRYDDSYHDWTPLGVGERSLRSIDIYRGDDGTEQMVVVGNSGDIYQRSGKERWEKLHSPTSKDLFSLALGDPDVAVGSGGVVIQRPRGETRQSGKSPDGDNYDGTGEAFDGDDNDPGENTSSDGSTGGTSGGSTDGTSGGSTGDSTDSTSDGSTSDTQN